MRTYRKIFIFLKFINLSMKVHFVPQGYEVHRILAGIILSQAEKVIIIRNKEKRLQALESNVQEKIEKVVKEIKSKKATYFFVKQVEDTNYAVNFFDFIDALKNVENWVSQELSKDNEVTVNISTGNSIINCALFCVSMKYNIPAYYIVPEYYEETPVSKLSEELLAKGITHYVILPKISLNYLADIPFDLLKALKKLGGKVDSITKLAIEVEPELKNLGEDKRRSRRMKISRQIEHLRSLGYVEISLKGKEKEIKLTNVGEIVLKYVE